MRFWLSITTFVVGLSLAAVGLVDQFENRPIDNILASNLEIPDRSYVLIPNKTLTAYPGEVQVVAEGQGQVFIATVRESDAVSWLESSPYLELRLSVDLLEETVDLSQIERPGEGNLIDPIGQDIWRTETRGDSVASISVPVGNEVAVLIASDGIELAPGEITIQWSLPDQGLPFSPLPLLGLVMMLLGSAGVVLDWWLRRKRASIGRRYRGQKPPRPRRLKPVVHTAPQKSSERRAARGLSFTALVLTAATLSGCTAEYVSPVINPQPSVAPDGLTPVMTRDQFERILGEVVAVVSEADAELNAEAVEARVAGPALATRRAAYNLARRTEAEDDGPEPIQAGPIQLFLPSATDTWPRSVMAVTGEDRLQLLVLTQESSRENYRLSSYVSLLPGADFPEVAAEELGANAIKTDSRFLSFDPTKLPEAVGDLINNPGESAWSALVDPENKYISDLVVFQQSLTETLSNANLSFTHALGSEQITLLASADGGALVALYMVDTYTIIPREPGDAVAITGDEALLLGTGGSATGIETKYGAMLLFHVPATGSEQPVRLLGANQQLLSAVNLGAR